MNITPSLSIITTVYNGSAFILRAYKNLLEQTFVKWEWIVMDDGSTDGTLAMVDQITDSRLRLISYPQNKGRGYARNLAVHESSGDWIVIWDVDDLHFPERLENIEQARLQGYDYFCSYAVVVNNDLEVKGIRGFFDSSGCLPRRFVHPTLALKKEIAKEVRYMVTKGIGGIGEDVRMCWKLSLKYKGLWHENAMTIYHEDREVNLVKTIDSNIAHIETLKELTHQGIICPDKKYVAYLMKNYVKIFILNIMRIYPRMYLVSVPFRGYGRLQRGWQLSPEKIDFIEKYKALKHKR